MKDRFFIGLLVLTMSGGSYSDSPAQEPDRKKRRPPVAVEHGKVFEKDGRRYLWGGKEESWHFDITTFRLDPSRLHHGKGREHFQSLIQPEFVTAKQADEWLEDDKRVLAVKIGKEVKAYPLDILLRHEVVNDIVGGRPILASYCILARFAAVYDRRLYDHDFTFGVSGYTYFDPDYQDGRDAFVLWDRETESLWWPVIGKAVSGPMIDRQMKFLNIICIFLRDFYSDIY